MPKYVFECSRGVTVIVAPRREAAKAEFRRECGVYESYKMYGPRDPEYAEQLAWVRAMGGWTGD